VVVLDLGVSDVVVATARKQLIGDDKGEWETVRLSNSGNPRFGVVILIDWLGQLQEGM